MKMPADSVNEGGLVDLLDRLLDRGAIVHADLTITLGEVPLIGINICALLGGTETLLRYGLAMETNSESPPPA
jgi:hypothetical protein